MHFAKQTTVAHRLMTLPGVGPLVVFNFVAIVDHEGRFRRSTDVGAFLGLTPRRYQSGENDRSGRIAKSGDTEFRRLLVPTATTLMTLVKRFSPLKSLASGSVRAKVLEGCGRNRTQTCRDPSRNLARWSRVQFGKGSTNQTFSIPALG